MAKSTIRVTLNGNGQNEGHPFIEFVRPDGSIEFGFDDYNTNETVRAAVYAYGLKQILADAGAVGRGTDDETRLNKMKKRAQSLEDGTWAFRDGLSEPKPGADYARQFQCLVDAALVPNDDAARAAWKAASPAERAAVWESDAMTAARALYAARKPKPRADVSGLLGALGL